MLDQVIPPTAKPTKKKGKSLREVLNINCTETLLVAVLIFLGFALRFSFRDWALPFVLFDDEPLGLEYSINFLAGNWLWHGKGFNDYPYLGLYAFSIFHRYHLIFAPVDSPTDY